MKAVLLLIFVLFQLTKGPSTNYVYKILASFDHLPNSSCKRSLWTAPNWEMDNYLEHDINLENIRVKRMNDPKGPSIKDVGIFSRFSQPMSALCYSYPSATFTNFWPLPPLHYRRLLWTAPNDNVMFSCAKCSGNILNILNILFS